MSLKKNKIYQGDCVKRLSKLEAGSVDLVFADPPFNIGYDYDVYDDAQSSDAYLSWCRDWISGVHRALKPDGTFWLAIGDEYAAELKIESQKIGFHCRSWVIWYYTFGVNCKNGFSRSHTHLFHFVKDKKKFTFNKDHPRIRVPSARQLVYADNRANPNGRLPDNTWITRPQDAPQFLSFDPVHDTWFFARVAGTFKEREGFHGCQMPEQLLARIIRTSSKVQDLVLDPFCGSGTTVSVAKKLARNWMGFELSKDYTKFINERLERIQVGDPIDGPEDSVKSAPSTARGKRKKKPFNEKTERVVVEAYQRAKFPADYILCNPELSKEFTSDCMGQGIGGSPYIWNRYLLALRKAGKLPKAAQRPAPFSSEQMDRFGYASEIAWRLLAIDYEKTLDDILCSPHFAAEFDRLAAAFGPSDVEVSKQDYRRAALSIRKRSHNARDLAAEQFAPWINKRKRLTELAVGDYSDLPAEPGVLLLCAEGKGVYAAECENMRHRIEVTLDANPYWRSLEPDSIQYHPLEKNLVTRYAFKSAIALREAPPLNCRLLSSDSELPR